MVHTGARGFVVAEKKRNRRPYAHDGSGKGMLMSCGSITYDDLRRRQALPLDVKVRITTARIEEWHDRWGSRVYLSYSGGKDSTVLLDLVKSARPDVPAVFCDTGLEYPEVRRLALSRADVVLRPDIPFNEVIKRYGYPFPSKEQALFIRQARHSTDHMRGVRLGEGRFSVSSKWRALIDAPFEVSEQCCHVMKVMPFHQYERETGRKRITAMMACESSKRELRYLQHGCNSFDGSDPSSMPMAFWTEQDVLRYILAKGLEYAACYGEIVEGRAGRLYCTREDRTGCMFCLFGIQYDGSPNRMQRMERDYPKQWDYCVNKLGVGRVLDFAGIPYRYQPTLFDDVA